MGQGGRLRTRAALFLGVGLGLTGLVLMAYGANLFRPWEYTTVDARFSIRGTEKPPANLVTVLIDTETFSDLKLRKQTKLYARWPFRRSFHARVLDRLREDGAKAIVYDVEFSEQSAGEQGAVDDNALATAICRLKLSREGRDNGAPPLQRDPEAVLAEVRKGTLSNDCAYGVYGVWIDQTKDGAYVLSRKDTAATRQGLAGDPGHRPGTPARPGGIALAVTERAQNGAIAVFGGQAYLRAIGGRAGDANVLPDDDGAVRRVGFRGETGLKTLAVVGTEIATGRPVQRSALPNNPAWIDYAGPPDTIPSVSFSKVLFGQTPKGFFRDKIVVVGPAASSLQDVHETSTTGAGEEMPGAEVQANALATALRGFPLRSTPQWFDLLLIFVCGVIVPLAGLRLSLRGTLFFGLAAMAALLVGTQLAFQAGVITSFIYPALALFLSTVGALAAYYVLSIFERQRTRDTFARFVPEAVVDQLLMRGGGAGGRLATTQVYGTCMFTDIRGFTTFSEGHDAPQVIDVLNRYLAEMSEAILRHGGTLASFLGDGFMAVFGAPLEQADHADRALMSAREIVEERLPRFNAQLQAEGVQGFKMGIGLNSGPFMSGNVGSEQRLQYTVIGDTINTASRIEGLTKGSGHIIFLADSTREALVNPPEDLVYVDEFDIRGRQSRVKLWSIAGRESEAPAAGADPAPEGVPAQPAGI
jgi:adenylate cyclase